MSDCTLATTELLDGDWNIALDEANADFTTEDIADVYLCESVYGDYAEWTGTVVGRLHDGRFFTAEGWCDTTGWGCRDDASAETWPDYDAFVRGIGDDLRAKLGIGIDGLGSTVVGV